MSSAQAGTLSTVRKVLLLIAGSLSLVLGIVGIVVPGLPTTPFLLLSAACYVRSSDRLYAWLIGHRVFGRYISTFRQQRGMSRRSKAVALVTMWGMIAVSVLLLIGDPTVRLVVVSAGVVGTVALILVRTV